MSFRKRLKETRKRYGPPTTEQIEHYRKIVKRKASKYVSSQRDEKQIKLFVERVPLDRGGYDRRGRYFGTGQKLYFVYDEDYRIKKYLRAESAKIAKDKVKSALEKYGLDRVKYMDVH